MPQLIMLEGSHKDGKEKGEDENSNIPPKISLHMLMRWTSIKQCG